MKNVFRKKKSSFLSRHKPSRGVRELIRSVGERDDASSADDIGNTISINLDYTSRTACGVRRTTRKSEECHRAPSRVGVFFFF